jgi:hypothetical protein
MSPAEKRSSVHSAILFGSVVIGFPVAGWLSTTGSFAWLAVAALLILSGWLFHKRLAFRAAFFVPLFFAPIIAALHVQGELPADSNLALGLFVLSLLIFVVGALAEAFWSPYRDDFADLEYRSRGSD